MEHTTPVFPRCTGKNGACENAARDEGMCPACDFRYYNGMYKTKREYEEWTNERGIRFRKIHGYVNKLCIKHNNTCRNPRAFPDGLCIEHHDLNPLKG